MLEDIFSYAVQQSVVKQNTHSTQQKSVFLLEQQQCREKNKEQRTRAPWGATVARGTYDSCRADGETISAIIKYISRKILSFLHNKVLDDSLQTHHDVDSLFARAIVPSLIIRTPAVAESILF